MTAIVLAPIGFARTPHTDPADTPVQSALDPDGAGQIHLDPSFADALDGLDEFDHLWIVSWLDQHADTRQSTPHRLVPYLFQRTPRELGMFATRTPRRPNPIGLSLVRLDGIEGHVINFRGVDLVDGTPILDIKPYAAPLDTPHGHPNVRSGWFDTTPLPRSATPTTLR